MVSINIERESLFGDESEEEDDMPRFAPLPDLDDIPGDNENAQPAEAGATGSLIHFLFICISRILACLLVVVTD